ncbi:3,4-dihydroxy-2-butanone-4-phosphate synthase RIB3 [Ascoidea rubescens DSM 1968]|uniref:3,4-dihydroxy-2-butanone 4-phosphate synthase n=1 Tax=Ascoidea rubescens DSM 1968 TaxID=1344418 RepID=A0A1D2VI42_9ASCO|nr:3,4-dihydroxy-2-butanone 4-phosphate synthase [Ascoidea rubescens DSM 1968]ODV61279.1 3,4-dihydroxy-2-butanone 4-phosphate synthase [Ascoidea rubescens DSM 1968]
MDDEDRENEGDLIIAAEFIDQQKMAFLVRHSSGYICAPLSNERADLLNLPLMLPPNQQTDRHRTAYTITVDFKIGTTTGISSRDRALTCSKLADPNSKPDDFLKPGHIVPLRAHPNLLKERHGHTEAAIQLCRLTDLQDAAVICELVRDDDGLMKRLDDCIEFSKDFNIKLITIKHLIDYINSNNL